MADGLTKKLADVTQTEAVVTCAFCGEKHVVSSMEFVIIYGDIRLGMDGDVVVGNIDDKGKIKGSTVLCWKHEFVQGLIKALNESLAELHEEQLRKGQAEEVEVLQG